VQALVVPPDGCLIEAPCPPCSSHGASIRQPFGAGCTHLVLVHALVHNLGDQVDEGHNLGGGFGSSVCQLGGAGRFVSWAASAVATPHAPGRAARP
jgi:hypothetical protein